MKLSTLFIIHAVLTFAAGVVLIVAPEAIPHTIGIDVQPDAYLICYLLGSTELGIAYLSYCARNISDVKSLRLICTTFMIFHASTAIVEVYAYLNGTDAKIWGNIALRIIVTALFGYYGLKKSNSRVAAGNIKN